MEHLRHGFIIALNNKAEEGGKYIYTSEIGVHLELSEIVCIMIISFGSSPVN